MLTRFAFRTAGRIFVEDDEDFLSASLRVISAPLSIENIPADTPLLFTAKVEEEGLALKGNVIVNVPF